jgi:hypothetical protein
MGAEAMCTVRFKGKTGAGKARLESDVLHFRGGDVKLSIRFKQMAKVVARGGTLTVTFPEGTAAFDLGPAAPKWQEKILHPPSRLAKLGAKPAWRVSAVGVHDDALSHTCPSAASPRTATRSFSAPRRKRNWPASRR